MQVYGYCIFKNGERAELLYPKEGFDADVSGRSFTHGRFVQRLRHAAASAPGVTVRQGTVKRLVNGENLPKPNLLGYSHICIDSHVSEVFCLAIASMTPALSVQSPWVQLVFHVSACWLGFRHT